MPSPLVLLFRDVKLCKFVKPVPSALRANTVPANELPPNCAVPYRVLPDKITSLGLAPSMPSKLCKFVKPAPSVLRVNTVPKPEAPPAYAVPYRVLLDKIKPFGPNPSLFTKGQQTVGVVAVK